MNIFRNLMVAFFILLIILSSKITQGSTLLLSDEPPAPTRKIVAEYIPEVKPMVVISDNRVTPSRSGRLVPTVTYTKEDLYWMARIVQAEAGNQPVEGKIAVANVILNRVNDSQFPDTIKEVIFAKNQFTPVKNGSIYNEPNPQVVEAVMRAFQGETYIDEGVVYFYNPDKVSKDSWIRTRKTYKQIGDHTFCYK